MDRKCLSVGARYGFKEPRSRVIQRPDDPLYRAFGEWLEGVPEGEFNYFSDQHEPHYKSALKIVEKIDGIKEKTTNEVQTVLLQYKTDPRIRNAGLFLSACYNLINQTDLVWDLDIDTRIDWIGYMIGTNKRLVLKADSGNEIGYQSSGLLVNYANVEGSMARHTKTPSVNFGSVGKNMASFAEAPSINFGSVGGWMAFDAKAPSVNFGSVGSEMAPSANNIQANIAIKNPNGTFHRNGEICLDEREAGRHPRLVKYFEDFKQQGEAYRDLGFPECLGIFDVVEQFVGSEENVNQQFMEKLRGLLD